MNPLFYNNFSTEDFVKDGYFRKITKRSSESDLELKIFLSNLPEKEAEIKQAVFIIRELETKKIRHSNRQKTESWNKVIWKERKRRLYLVSRYAAAFLLLLAIGSVSYQIINRKPLFSGLESTEDLLMNNQTMILINGQRFYVPGESSTIKYSDSGETILLNDSVKIKIQDCRKYYSQIVVPFGNRTKVNLSDGSAVWLNSGSKIVSYPVFKGKSRNVYIEGEAYFEVQSDKKKPFNVLTDAFQVKATGTRFDVHANKNEKIYDVVLLEGKVSLNLKNQLLPKEVELNPNQRGMLNISEQNFMIEEVNHAENYITWRDGYLIFENEDIRSIFNKISHYYNIQIVYDSSRLHRKVYGKLLLKDNPEDLLDGLASISNTTFRKINNSYYFRRKPFSENNNPEYSYR